MYHFAPAQVVISGGPMQTGPLILRRINASMDWSHKTHHISVSCSFHLSCIGDALERNNTNKWRHCSQLQVENALYALYILLLSIVIIDLHSMGLCQDAS